MENLAGDPLADRKCARELQCAGIPLFVKDEEPRGEVKSAIVGRLGQFTFERAWYYWMVSGSYIPIEMANELYANSIGKETVRVNGDCTRPPPAYYRRGVDSYHIDSAEGLKLFADTVRKYGLGKPTPSPAT